MKDRKEKKYYTYRSIRDERQYGLYWYSGLWRVLRPVLVALTVLVLVLGIGTVAWNKLYGEFAAPLEENLPPEATDVPFEIQSGDSLNRVASNLEAAGLIRSKTVFKYYCDFVGMGQKIQVGSYSLRQDMTMMEIADRLAAGDGRAIVRNITLIPGESVEDFANRMVKNGVFESADTFLALCKTGEKFSDYYYIADVRADSRSSGRKYVLEGYLAPNTYEVYVTATEEDIIRKLLSQTEAVFPEEYELRADELNMTMDQVLTLASLIEKEAGEGDFARVSAVFHNRLKAGMKLQSDVTIHYITGVRKMALAEGDLTMDSPYNTYRYNGLPLGPICNPSPKAIQAALYPDETLVAENYLYFCAKEPESGELYFSRTLAEHERAVAVYAPLWQAYDQSRGIQ
ncbi:MAG: endolytic transglycosylase MltG [Clostridiales bacterium]|nr:endolytic transglycosylase MltG [Clostridiales bacterium]